jgi:hypothetical protein
MKKDDELLESRIDDEEEDLFDLSLDDLEPEDTIVEPHIEEPDDEIIDLIDLVQKGDIDLGEEVEEPSAAIFTGNKEPAAESADELKTDETLDLLDIPLDEEISFDEFEEGSEKETGESGITSEDLKFFIEGDQSEAMAEVPAELFSETPIESAFEEPLTGKEDALELPEIEGALIAGLAEPEGERLAREREKTVRISPEEEKAPESLHDMKIEELEQLPGVAFEVIKKEQETALQQVSSTVEEVLPPTAEKMTGISEEKIEAIIRKVVEESVEKVARETMTQVAEKFIVEAKKEETPTAAEAQIAISEEKIEAIVRKVVEEAVPRIAEEKITGAVEKIMAGAKKEETQPVVEAPIAISEEKIEAILRKVVEETVERVARETMAGVAERVITDAINALQKSIESASD